MAIGYVGGQTGSTGGQVLTYTASFSLSGGEAGFAASTPAAGDLVLIDVADGTAANRLQDVTGYTLIGTLQYQNDSADSCSGAFHKFMPGTPDADFTITTGGAAVAGQPRTFQVRVYRGVDPTNPLDVAAALSGQINSGIPNPDPITPVTPGARIVVFGAGAFNANNVATGYSNSGSLNNWLSDKANGSATFTAALGGGDLEWDGLGVYDPVAFGLPRGANVNDSSTWATLALRPAASGPATATGTASGSMDVGGSGTGAAPASGQGAGALGAAGAAQGAAVAQGQGSGSLDVSGTSAGGAPAAGQGAGGVGLSGTSAGTTPAKGQGTGGADLAGSASGAAPAQGAGQGGLSPTGAAQGRAPSAGQGSGSVPLSGSSTGGATSASSGAGGGTMDLAGSSQGTAPARGAGSGGLDLTGQGTGAAPARAQGTGALPIGGTGQGGAQSSAVTGVASGSLPLGGQADGRAPVAGQGDGSLPLAGSGTGGLGTKAPAAHPGRRHLVAGPMTRAVVAAPASRLVVAARMNRRIAA